VRVLGRAIKTPRAGSAHRYMRKKMNTKIEIKRFWPSDAEDCFRIRASAFIKLFYDEIGSDAVAKGVNAFMPADYIRFAEKQPVFVAFEDLTPVGFIAARFIDQSTIEILFLYVHLDFLGKGIGTMLISHFESWLGKHHKRLQQILVDTAVPKYNQRFYEKIGYSKVGNSECQYPDGSISAVRLAKKLS
jgi:GNAT superfamily N-acetyltransferase